MLWYCLQKINLDSIEHKYFITGHTQNEADSMHAAIEAASKKLSIYTTSQWAAIIRAARNKAPSEVKEMCGLDFYDFKDVISHLKNFRTNTEHEKINRHSIKTIKFIEQAPNIFHYQTDYDGPVIKAELFNRLRLKDILLPQNIKVKYLALDGFPISQEKYCDLLYLC